LIYWPWWKSIESLLIFAGDYSSPLINLLNTHKGLISII